MVFLIFVTVVSCLMVLAKWIDRQEIKDEETDQRLDIEEIQEEDETNSFGTRTLFLDTLTKIGCQYELNGESNIIGFPYQGGYFMAIAENDSSEVQIYDTYWGSINLDNTDEVSRMKTSVNEANKRTTVNVVYTIDEEKNRMFIYSRKDFIFSDTLPDMEDYLRFVLDSFFHVHHFIGYNMMKLKEEDYNDEFITIVIVNQK